MRLTAMCPLGEKGAWIVVAGFASGADPAEDVQVRLGQRAGLVTTVSVKQAHFPIVVNLDEAIGLQFVDRTI